MIRSSQLALSCLLLVEFGGPLMEEPRPTAFSTITAPENRLLTACTSRTIRKISVTLSIGAILAAVKLLYSGESYAVAGLSRLLFVIIALQIYRLFLLWSESPQLTYCSAVLLSSTQMAWSVYDGHICFCDLFLLFISFNLPSTLINEYYAAERFVTAQQTLRIIELMIPCQCILLIIDLLLLLFVQLICKLACLSLTEQPFGKLRRRECIEAGCGILANDTECSICKIPFEDDDTARLLKCHHVFHPACIDEWLAIKHSCPLCKQTIINGSSLRDILQPVRYEV